VQGSGTEVVVPDVRVHAGVQEPPDCFNLAAQQVAPGGVVQAPEE
jgi:hypothetical protein